MTTEPDNSIQDSAEVDISVEICGCDSPTPSVIDAPDVASPDSSVKRPRGRPRKDVARDGKSVGSGVVEPRVSTEAKPSVSRVSPPSEKAGPSESLRDFILRRR